MPFSFIIPIFLAQIFDPALVTYPSESLPGYFLAILDIIGWVWYMRSSYVTVRKYPLKRSFFTNLALPITLWFWAGPIVLVIANFVLDDWVREEVVLGVDYQMMIIGYLVFLVSEWKINEERLDIYLFIYLSNRTSSN
jgi:hypothetical protein